MGLLWYNPGIRKERSILRLHRSTRREEQKYVSFKSFKNSKILLGM
jgi:hypothetical protein